MSGGGCGGHRPDDRGWGRGNRPVINVSWEDAQRYVTWLTRRTGEAYRLLSESEWEYAARAGTTTPFHFGRTISTDQANYDGDYRYGTGRKGRDRKKTVPVGSFAANRFGLHDVHGNVWEWVQDCWNPSYHGAPRDGRAWERRDCSQRVLRGGSWLNEPWLLRSAIRNRNSSGNRKQPATGSVLPGRSLRESLPLYFFSGVQGAKPLVDSFGNQAVGRAPPQSQGCPPLSRGRQSAGCGSPSARCQCLRKGALRDGAFSILGNFPPIPSIG